jgi:hypothetical protein
MPLPEDYWTLQSRIKKQMPDTIDIQTINDTIESTYQFIMYLVITACLFHFLMEGAFVYLVQMIRAL